MKKIKLSKRVTTPDRTKLISDGYYDGRYRPKIYIDRKKEAKKNGTI